MELIRDGVRIEWVDLGEGLNGDYDESDPEDMELLRFDVSLWDVERGEWNDQLSDASFCTLFPARAPDGLKRAALELIMDACADELLASGSAKATLERLSGVRADWPQVIDRALRGLSPREAAMLAMSAVDVHPDHGPAIALAVLRQAGSDAAAALEDRDLVRLLRTSSRHHRLTAITLLSTLRPDAPTSADAAAAAVADQPELSQPDSGGAAPAARRPPRPA